MILIWNVDSFLKVSAIKRNRWTYVEGKLIDKDMLISVVPVYGPNDKGGRNEVWKELINLKLVVECPAMIFGNFNEIINPEERKGNSQTSIAMIEF